MEKVLTNVEALLEKALKAAIARYWTPENLAFAKKHLPPSLIAFGFGYYATRIGILCLFVFLGTHNLLPQTGNWSPGEWTIGLILQLIYCWGGLELVLFNRGWWGRKLRPRLWLWWLLAVASVILLAYPLIWQALTQAESIYDFQARPNLVEYLNQLLHQNPLTKHIAVGFGVNVVALLGALGLILNPTPAKWASFNRFRLFLLALVTFAGRPAAFYVFSYLFTWDQSGDWFVAELVLVPIALPVLGTLTLLATGFVIGLVVVVVFFVTVSLPLKLYDFLNLRDQRAQVRAQKIMGLEYYIARFHLWLRHDRLPNVPDERKGARFATPAEIEAARFKDGFAFGHVGGRPLFLETEKHVLLMASTRSGKGVTVIIPHLLRYPGSAFVLDPKGENARATGRRRAMLNDKVHYLDPFGISGKPQSRFNPLASFTADNMEAASKALAAAMILEPQRDHWTASAQQLLAALILYVVTCDDFEPRNKDLPMVRKLLLGAIKPALVDMEKSAAVDGLVADLAASFLNTPEKELGSIISNAQRETEILDNPYISACLKADGPGEAVDFADWRNGTMSVFLCLSAPKFPTFNRWLRLVLTSALDEMTDQLNPPPLPVCFMLDELATLGHVAPVENAIGLAAGYGVQLVSVFQDTAQMKDLYKGRWASFIGNAGVRVLFSLDDYDTAKYWSEFMGGHLVGTMSEAQDIYGLVQGQTASETRQPLLSPEQLMLRYASGKMLLLKQGMRPIEADRVPYWTDATLQGLSDDPRVRPAQGSAQPKPSAPPPGAAPSGSPPPPGQPPQGPAPTSSPKPPPPSPPAQQPVSKATPSPQAHPKAPPSAAAPSAPPSSGQQPQGPAPSSPSKPAGPPPNASPQKAPSPPSPQEWLKQVTSPPPQSALKAPATSPPAPAANPAGARAKVDLLNSDLARRPSPPR